MRTWRGLSWIDAEEFWHGRDARGTGVVMSVSPSLGRMIEFDRDPGVRVLMLFAPVPLVFGVVLGLVLWLGAGLGWGALAITGGLGLAGSLVFVLIPPVRRPMYVGWMLATVPASWLISHALLAGVYYLVLTPIGLVMRAIGRDPLDRAIRRDTPTYWVERAKVTDPARYFRQF